jgi:hypothetical protein
MCTVYIYAASRMQLYLQVVVRGAGTLVYDQTHDVQTYPA